MASNRSFATTTEPRNVSSTRTVYSTATGDMGAEPTDQAIRERAYEIFLARGASPGNELEDWQQAERDLKAGAKKSKY